MRYFGWDEFIGILAHELNTDPTTIRQDSRLKQDLGMDSFQKVSFAVLLEDLLDITIDDDGIAAALTAYQLFTLTRK